MGAEDTKTIESTTPATRHGLSQVQVDRLRGPLDASVVQSRSQAGRNLSYITGHYANQQTNEILGYGRWSREMLSLECVVDEARQTPDKGERWHVTYRATVRIHVFDENGKPLCFRDGTGVGHGIDRDRGQAHESASKESETDATKRALSTFGNPLGLALYDKSQEAVADPAAIAWANDVRERFRKVYGPAAEAKEQAAVAAMSKRVNPQHAQYPWLRLEHLDQKAGDQLVKILEKAENPPPPSTTPDEPESGDGDGSDGNDDAKKPPAKAKGRSSAKK